MDEDQEMQWNFWRFRTLRMHCSGNPDQQTTANCKPELPFSRRMVRPINFNEPPDMVTRPVSRILTCFSRASNRTRYAASLGVATKRSSMSQMTRMGAPFTIPPYKHGSTSPDRMPTLLTIPSKNRTQVRLAMRCYAKSIQTLVGIKKNWFIVKCAD